MNAKNGTTDQHACSNADGADANLYLTCLNDIRRTRLAVLIQERADGNVSKFAESLNYSRSQVHQFLSPTYNEGRSIGELAARQLEQRAGLKFGWLDQRLDADAEIAAATAVHDQLQLAAQREAADAVARVGFLSSAAGGLTVPAKAGTQPPTMSANPWLQMYPGEIYAGIVPHQLGKAHLILLPSEACIVGAEAAEEFANSIGGQLPTYAELEYLGKRLSHCFKAGLYYTCDQEEYDGDMATVMWARLIDEATSITRVRAIRRVLAVPALTISSLSQKQVAELANRLIDQRSLGDSDDSDRDELIANAGIKVGIGIMAMEIQRQIADAERLQGQSHA